MRFSTTGERNATQNRKEGNLPGPSRPTTTSDMQMMSGAATARLAPIEPSRSKDKKRKIAVVEKPYGASRKKTQREVEKTLSQILRHDLLQHVSADELVRFGWAVKTLVARVPEEFRPQGPGRPQKYKDKEEALAAERAQTAERVKRHRTRHAASASGPG
jgi:hypothetical protein